MLPRRYPLRSPELPADYFRPEHRLFAQIFLSGGGSLKDSALLQDITRAYRSLALRYHPDKAVDMPRVEAQKKMASLTIAYKVAAELPTATRC